MLLLVEDNEVEARAAVRVIKGGMPIRVMHVTSAAEAMAAVLTGGIDLVLLDLNLPDAKEMEVLSSLRSVDGEVPIVVWTGSQGPGMAGEARRRGADDFLVKGVVTGDELLASVARCVNRRRHAEAA